MLEAVVRLRVAQDFALAGLLELTPAGISGYLRLLKLSQLIEDTIGELPFGGVIALGVQGRQLTPMLR